MRPGREPLDHAILAAFKSAQDAGRLDVAEHLLRALECLCGGAIEGSAAQQAYRLIGDCAEAVSPRRPQPGKRKR